MRLLTHNMLSSSHKRGVVKGYPLNLVIEKSEVIKQDLNEMFLKHRLPKINWNAFTVACKAAGISDIPSEFNENLLNDKNFLEKCHHVLLEIHVINGALICPESNRKFPIKDGIPNMLLNEDELPNVTEEDLIKNVKKRKNKQAKEDDQKISTTNEKLNDSNDKDNPYLDPSLMKGLNDNFSPKQNEEFLNSHQIDKKNDVNGNDVVMKD